MTFPPQLPHQHHPPLAPPLHFFHLSLISSWQLLEVLFCLSLYRLISCSQVSYSCFSNPCRRCFISVSLKGLSESKPGLPGLQKNSALRAAAPNTMAVLRSPPPALLTQQEHGLRVSPPPHLSPNHPPLFFGCYDTLGGLSLSAWVLTNIHCQHINQNNPGKTHFRANQIHNSSFNRSTIF